MAIHGATPLQAVELKNRAARVVKIQQHLDAAILRESIGLISHWSRELRLEAEKIDRLAREISE